MRKAVKRGKTLEGLAASIGRDPRAVARTLLAKKPHVESVRLMLVEVLGHDFESPTVVARALLGLLSYADQRDAMRLLEQRLQSRSHPEIYPEMVNLAAKVRSALSQAPPKRQCDALRKFIIAERGLDERDSVEVIASALGVTIPSVDAAAQRGRQFEAAATLIWLLKVLGLEHRTRARLAQAVEPISSEFPLLRAILLEDEIDIDLAESERLANAITAARRKLLQVSGLARPKAPAPMNLDFIREGAK